MISLTSRQNRAIIVPHQRQSGCSLSNLDLGGSVKSSFFPSSRKRKEVSEMYVEWSELFEFVQVIVSIMSVMFIALSYFSNNNKKR